MEFAIGGLAAASAGFFTNPIQLSKAHLKVHKKLRAQGHSYARNYKNVFHAGYLIARKEGLFALQKGLTSSLWMHKVKYGLKLGTYHTAYSKGYTTDENGKIIVLRSVGICALGGMVGQFMSHPLYVIRTLLQSEAAKGNHSLNGIWKPFIKLYRKEGVPGLYNGIRTCVPYSFIGTSQLTTFGCTKEWLCQHEIFRNDKLLTASIASTVGAVVLSFFMTPFDYVVHHYQEQPKKPDGKNALYTGYFDCIRKLYKTKGALAFVRGFGPMFVKIGPHTILCLVFWDGLKHLHEKHWENLSKFDVGF